MTAPHEREVMARVLVWLGQLRDITVTGKDPVSTSKLELYARMLAAEFPPDEFSVASLRFVSLGQTYFPALEVVRARLNDLRGQRVGRLALPDASLGHLSPEEAGWVRRYRRMVAPGSATSDVAVDVWLEQMERLHPRAFLQVLNETVSVESHKPPRLARRLEAMAHPARQPLPGYRPSVRPVRPAAPERTISEQLEALVETNEKTVSPVSRPATAVFSENPAPEARQIGGSRHAEPARLTPSELPKQTFGDRERP